VVWCLVSANGLKLPPRAVSAFCLHHHDAAVVRRCHRPRQKRPEDERGPGRRSFAFPASTAPTRLIMSWPCVHRRKIEAERKAKADAEVAARAGGRDASARADAEALITAWNERQAPRMPLLFAPTIGATLVGRASFPMGSIALPAAPRETLAFPPFALSLCSPFSNFRFSMPETGSITLAWLNRCRGLAKDWENRNRKACGQFVQARAGFGLMELVAWSGALPIFPPGPLLAERKSSRRNSSSSSISRQPRCSASISH
jgi:hypothetical protein